MKIPANINNLLSGQTVEWARLEFKETWNADSSLKTICAFANDIDNWGGGYLIIGISNERDRENNLILKGVETNKIDGYLKDMLNKFKLIQPEYMPITEIVDFKSKKFIVVWAPGGNLRPYSSPKTMSKDNRERVSYIRKLSSTIAPTQEEIRELYNLANNIPFDDRVNHEANISDIKRNLVKEYLYEVKSSLYDNLDDLSIEELCKNLNLICELPEYIKPRNIALMFFNPTPDKFFPQAQIDIVLFPDEDEGGRLDERIFKGPLHIQLRDALQYISNNIIAEKIIKVEGIAESNRFFNYPYEAIEEALSNCVYHKGYDVREPIEVRVLADRIEMISHPGADRSITQTHLKEYRAISRRYRNRRIGDFLKELRLTEGRNTGFRKIVSSLRNNGSPEPLFETDLNRTYFVTTLYIHPLFIHQNKNEVINEVINEGIKIKLNKGQLSLYQAIKFNEGLNAIALSSKLGNRPLKTIQRQMKILVDSNLVEYQGSRKNGGYFTIK
ncbi:RNA-binding domain-containing protein [Anaerorhabdus furcosa]|uniref:ATP-dependent DNA helicase RecG n=1 Tax=Anaerorhabdus furcosa TaxID=118967 RepID=A0A1T4MEZ0_9FIRM|nr:RNA-binding domain-containing protein [Anaerorhabdus furcosa]SJZ65451.1 ATP-dependent DNA helicase RecG [Anaerorhabdus furcosa]